MKTRIFTLLIAFMATLQLFAITDFTIDGIGYTKLGGDSVEVGENSGITGDVVIPATVTNGTKTYRGVAIGGSAFAYCSGLTSVTIGNSVTSIGGSAFAYCSGLTSVTIGNSVTSIGGSAFAYCSGLTSTTIPNSVTIIKDHVFESCRNLNSVNIPNSITSIGEGAFGSCTSLTSIVLPNSVTTIDNWAFASSGLTSITIPNSVTSIGSSVFGNCISLTSVTIPNSVTSIGSNVFENTAISTPVYNDHLFIYLPYSYSGEYIIPEGITTIVAKAFYEHNNLTNIVLPTSLRNIKEYAIYGCRNISSIIIPANVDTIEREAFNGCVDLVDVYLYAVKPPYVGYSSWSDYYNAFTSNPTIHLACGVDYAAYQNSTWSNYNLEYPEPNYTLTLSSDTTQGTIRTRRALSCNNDTAVIYAQANAGYHFTSWSDGNTDNPRTVIMTQDKTLHANFAVSLYTFTATANDAARGTVTANSGSYQYGTELTMSATPAEHYFLDHWQIERERIVDGGGIVAKFSVPDTWQDTYAWIWETGGYGHWETLPQENGWYVYRTNADNMHILLAHDQSFGEKTPDIDLTESACYTIESNGSQYYSDVAKSYDCITADDYEQPYTYIDTFNTPLYQEQYTLTLTSNTKATAIFLKEKHYVNFTCLNGKITCNDSYPWESYNDYIEHDSIIHVSVIPYDGYIFQQWEDGNTDNPRTFIVTERINMQATCIRNQSVLTLNTSDDEAGRVFGAGSYDKYSSVQIFAIPNSGYDFVGWSDNNTANPRYIYLDESEISLTANFDITSAAQYIVNVTAQNPEQGSATATNYVRLDAAPFDGCTFVRWSDGNTDNPRYMELNADITLQAIFEGTPSGIEDPSSAPKGSVRKVMINGQIYILRGEKVYTLQGQEAK